MDFLGPLPIPGDFSSESDDQEMVPLVEPLAPEKRRCCAGCGEGKFVNQLLLDVSQVDGSGDWQGQKAYCLGCAQHRGMLRGVNMIEGADREDLIRRYFHREQRKRWIKMLGSKRQASKVLRADNFLAAKRQCILKNQSLKSQLEKVKRLATARRMAADINSQIPSRRLEAINAIMEHRKHCEAEQQDSARSVQTTREPPTAAWQAQATPAAIAVASGCSSQSGKWPPILPPLPIASRWPLPS